METVLKNPWVQALVTLAVLVLVVMAVKLLSFVLIPLFFAFLIAYVFDPVADLLERFKVPRLAASIGLLLLLLFGLLSIPLLILPDALQEGQRLMTALHTTTNSNRVLQWLPLDSLVRELGWEQEGQAPIDTLLLRTEALIEENAAQYIQAHMKDLANIGWATGTSLWNVLTTLGTGMLSAGLFLGNLVLFVIMVVYLLCDFDQVVASGRDLIPLRYRPKTQEIMGRIDRQLRAFFRGQATVCLFMGIMYGSGLRISGAPFALLLGLLGGLATFVPYMGPLVVVVPSVLFTLLAGGSWGTLLGIAITVGVAQTLEGNILTPRIVGSQVGLGPLWIILAIVVFGTLLGFLGLLLAVPIAAALKVLVDEALVRYKRSRIFNGTVGGGEAAPPV